MHQIPKFELPKLEESEMVEKKSSNVRFDLDVYNELQQVLVDNKISGQGANDLATWVTEACSTMMQVNRMLKDARLDITMLRPITVEAVKRYIKDSKAKK